MIFQVKKQRVQCYRVDSATEKRVMITSIKLNTQPEDVDYNDERNAQLTDKERSMYAQWFLNRSVREDKKRDMIFAEYDANRANRIDIDVRELLRRKKDLTDADVESLIDCSVDVLKILKPEVLEPKITLKMYLKSLFSG